MIALKKGLETSAAKFFFGYTVEAQLGKTVSLKTQRLNRFASFLRNGQRWRVIFDTRFIVFKENVICWDQYTGKNQVKRTLNVEGTPLVMVLHMSTSIVHVHRT